MVRTLDRRQLLETAAWLTFLASQFGAAEALPQKLKNRLRARRPEKLLLVVTANGGASIIDSLLPLLAADANSRLRSYTSAQLDNAAGSAFSCVKPIPFTLGVPVNTSYHMREFLNHHGSDTAVVTHEGTSVNHLIASQRSLNGNGSNRGRTLMEAVAAAYGEQLLLPNINMGFGGYASPGTDPNLPRLARSEAVADALLFPLALHRDQKIAGRTDAELLEATRQLRAELDQSFQAAHRNSSLLADFTRFQANIPKLEAAQLLEALMFFDHARLAASGPARAAPNPLLQKIRGVFPAYATDPLEAQAALAFLMFRYGLSSAVTIGLDDMVRFQQQGEQKEMLHLPLAFDWSHNNHQAAQNTMWRRIFYTLDRLIQLMKDEDYLGQPEQGRIWERSLVYIATEFGRDREKSRGSGHHLNNGSVMVSPLLQGNRIYGGLDASTGLTYGFDPRTGEPDPQKNMEEADGYSLILEALGVSFAGQRLFPGVVRRSLA